MYNFRESKIFAVRTELGESIISTQPSFSLRKYDIIICQYNNRYITAVIVKVSIDTCIIFDIAADREYIIDKESVAGIVLGFIKDGKVIKYPDSEYFNIVKRLRRKYYLHKLKKFIRKND